MENKKLSDSELEKVNGGQAVLPLLSTENPNAVHEQAVTSEVKTPFCPGCDDKC